jgi:hypothetical protein
MCVEQEICSTFRDAHGRNNRAVRSLSANTTLPAGQGHGSANNERITNEENNMRNALTILASVLLAGSLVQVAAASERHQAQRAHRAPVATGQTYRDSNAYYQPGPGFRTAPEPDVSYYQNRGLSAPAGH